MEMLIVLMVISMFACVMPFVSYQKQIQFRYEMRSVKEILKQQQLLAIQEHRSITVNIEDTYLNTETDKLNFINGMNCEPLALHYSASGNVSQASTLRCQLADKEMRLVIELGSGTIYVR